MESLVVEPSTGLVGVSSLIKAAVPDLHPGSVLRSVNNVLNKSDGFEMTTKTVNGKIRRMASLDVCNYILENMPGHRWTVWRTANGESFKESLAQTVEQIRSSAIKEVVEVPEEVKETKAKTLKKAFRTLDIEGSVRIDEASGKASVIDVIRVLSPGASVQYSAQLLIRLLENEDATDIGGVCILQTENADCIAARIQYIQINGAGRSTPVSDAKTIVEIIWLLPASAARSFRRQSAEVICRVLGGDASLCGEIEERCSHLSTTPEGKSFQNFTVDSDSVQPVSKKTRFGPEIMELATEEEYAKYVRTVVSSIAMEEHVKKVKTEVSLIMALKGAFEVVAPLEPRHKIELCDKISDIQRRAFGLVSEPTGELVNIPKSTQDAGHGIPTPKCSHQVRGDEVSIAMIATSMGVSVRGRAGLVGRKLKELYADRYGTDAANGIPKRNTIYAGRPYLENMYFARDKDLVERAIRLVVKNYKFSEKYTPLN